MLYIENNITNPYYNLALEEYVLKNAPKGEQYLLLWQNQPSIIIGKHQNTIEEINQSFVKERNINVVRRLSGGGAVYHDLGNLNFSFIVDHSHARAFDFKQFTAPIILALEKLGVNAEFNSRNDLAIDGKKFSGNSQYIKGDKLLHHGTLLFNSNLEDLESALCVSQDKIESKGAKSIRSRVTNICEHLKVDSSIMAFKEALLKSLFNGEAVRSFELAESDYEKIRQMMETKYLKWEWNYGESPKHNIKRSRRFDQGKVEVLLDIAEGTIKCCKFYGDFFGSGDLEKIEKILIGCRHEELEIYTRLKNVDIDGFFSGFSVEQLVRCLC